jgi:hypothetical protein
MDERDDDLITDDELDTEGARRRMLTSLGIYGAATAPILLAALKSEKAAAQSGPFGPPIPGGPSVF